VAKARTLTVTAAGSGRGGGVSAETREVLPDVGWPAGVSAVAELSLKVTPDPWFRDVTEQAATRSCG
jgi:hypothetical protein